MIDLASLKTAAHGRWVELLTDIGQVSHDLLDGHHHPCPRCGGTDRFRMIDAEAGALYCNQCFSEKNGDGIAAVQWLLQITFEEAVQRIADRLGIKVFDDRQNGGAGAGRRRRRQPDEQLEFYGFNESLVALWTRWKPGVTAESVQAQGGQAARWRGLYTVITLPILSMPPLQAPTGWVMWNSTGEPLPKSRKESAKILATRGSKAGWIGAWALPRLAEAEVIWKVEGPTDLLALWAAIPPDLRERHLVLTNPFGASEKSRHELLEAFRGRVVNVCMDNDPAGLKGAARWGAAIAKVAKECRVVQLPAGGAWKDIRDWLVAGGTYQELLSLAAAAEPLTVKVQEGCTLTVNPHQPAPGIHPEGTSAAPAPPAQEPPGEQDTADEADDDPSRLARAFLRYRARRVACYLSEIYYWESGQWRKKADDVLRSDVTCFLRTEFHRLNIEARQAARLKEGESPKVHKIKNELTNSVITNLKAYCCVPPEIRWGSEIVLPEDVGMVDQGEERHWIAVENGILQLEAYLDGAHQPDQLLRPHDLAWWSPHRLPYAFELSAGPPQRPCWEGFLARNLEGDPDRIAILQEWAGYCLIPETSMQRFLILEGEGANGKSVYCAVLEALLGPANVSHVPLELFAERFSLSSTVGKLANVATEVGDLDKVAEGFLKAFVSGDPMTFDRKGREPIEVLPTARLLIATNNRPRFSDRSGGLWRRMLLVPFNIQIPEGDRVPGMDKSSWWLRSGEMPAILNWALEGLSRLLQRRRFSESTTTTQAIEEYRIESNPAMEFLVETYQFIATGQTGVSEVYQAYREWCEKSGHRPLASTTFGKEVKRAFPVTHKALLGTRAKRKSVYIGIARIDEVGCGSVY